MAPINNQIGTPTGMNAGLQFDDDDDSGDENLTGPMLEDDDLEEIDFVHRTEDDILHGCLPDSMYYPVSMEADGVHPQELNWSYTDVVPGTPNTEHVYYNGAGPCLRRYVDRKFDSLLGACGIAGGFSYELIKCITMNSNAYVQAWLVGNKFYGFDWKNIMVEEMFHMLGMILKIEGLFQPLKKLYISCDEIIKLRSIEMNWTDDRLTLKRFLQIRAALHPEIGVSDIGDKCHQLRAAIQSLNQAAKKSFVLGRQISFDEGGIASKSRYNPVRQYNASKPDKYRIDFFIMVNATSGMNFIYHLDVYQGKNATNAFIAEEAHNLPTTQKAVVNAIVLSGIANDSMREIYMDNHFSALELFVLCYEKY